MKLHSQSAMKNVSVLSCIFLVTLTSGCGLLPTTNGSNATGGGGGTAAVNENNSANINENKNSNANKAEVKPSPEKPKAELPEFKKGESYAKVREKLLTAGWTPHRAKDADKCGEGDERCQGRPEMQSCAGTGMANCKFLWKRSGKTLAIFTVGEDAAYDGQEFENAPATDSKRDDEMLPPRADTTMRGMGLVFAPPSYVRASPNGKPLCTITKETQIKLLGSTNIKDNNGFWVYTDHCGKMGVIHSTQFNVIN